MLSLNHQKLLRKLRLKKYRWRERLFIAEGQKVISDIMSSGLQPTLLVGTRIPQGWEVTQVPEKLLGELSQQHQPDGLLAVFPFPEIRLAEPPSRILVLDGVADPGNVGTLQRTAEWFGYELILHLPGTADVYNAKTVQSSMGSVARVKTESITHDALPQKLADYDIRVADMRGNPLPKGAPKPAAEKVALVLGSESHGPSAIWQEIATYYTIAKPPQAPIDSLNVAVSGAIFMHTWAGH